MQPFPLPCLNSHVGPPPFIYLHIFISCLPSIMEPKTELWLIRVTLPGTDQAQTCFSKVMVSCVFRPYPRARVLGSWLVPSGCLQDTLDVVDTAIEPGCDPENASACGQWRWLLLFLHSSCWSEGQWWVLTGHSSCLGMGKLGTSSGCLLNRRLLSYWTNQMC